MTAPVQTAGSRRAWPSVLGLAVCAIVLGGCGMMSDQTAGSLMVSPGKYRFHNCQLLASSLSSTRNRIDELEKLTARASQGTAGAAISAAAYRTEYLQARADEREIRATIGEKNCRSDSPWTSERTVY